MATAEEKKEEGEGEAVTMEAQSPSRPVLNSRRKPSFSQAFTNITTNPFNRRRTATTVSDLASADTHIHSSRLPTPSGIPRSTSFFSSLGAFASKPASTNDANESSAHSAPPKRSRIISSRLAQAPFFSYQQQDVNTTPLTTKQKRESSVQIEQRGLMAPLHPPMPRSSTMGNLGQSPQAQSSPNTPSFMRPTSSSAARRSSLNTPRQRIPPMPTIPAMPTMSAKKTPTLGRRVPSFGFKTASNTPATPATPAIQRARPVKTPVRSVVKPETPPDSGVLAPNNTPESEHTTSSHHSQEPASRIRTSSQPHHTRKSSLIPAPIQARRNVSQDMAQRQEQNPLPSFSDFGDDGTNEFQGPKIHDSGPEEDTTALEQIQERDESSRAETVVPAGTAKETPSETTTHPDGEEENAGEPMGLTSASEVNADDDDDAPEPLPANLDMSNPRLIHTALHILEWAGRFTSLSDRFRTSALPSQSSPSPQDNNSSSSTTSLNASRDEPMNDEERRKKRVYIHLKSLCTTNEARESLAAFKIFMEERDKAMSGGPKGSKIKEKHGFFQSLMGKKK